jgi:hypothetical protein
MKKRGPGKLGRVVILVAEDGTVVGGILGEAREVAGLARDRVANGEAFPGERPIRLPRRMTRPRWRDLKVDKLAALRDWTYRAEGTQERLGVLR